MLLQVFDCFSMALNEQEMAEKMKKGQDVAPIEATFRICRKQGTNNIFIQLEETRLTDGGRKTRYRTWDWMDRGGAKLRTPRDFDHILLGNSMSERFDTKESASFPLRSIAMFFFFVF